MMADRQAVGLDAGQGAVAAALFATWILWGTTYTAMHFAVQGLPPMMMASGRFLCAGAVLFMVLRLRGARLPGGRQALAASAIGILMLVGNGVMGIVVKSIPSGFASMVGATTPLWLTLYDAATGRRPDRRELAGLAVGFAGVAVLGAADLSAADPAVVGLAFLTVLSWSAGVILTRRIRIPSGAATASVQMLAAGVALALISAALGEAVPDGVAWGTALPFAYLVFVAVCGFSSFVFLTRAVRISLASSYAYVNPAVALAAGALIAGEPLTLTAVVSLALILAGVALIVAPRRA